MKKMFAVMMGVVWMSALSAVAQATGQQTTTEVPQAELAKLMCQTLGISMPVTASPLDYCQALMNQGISPAGGWSPNTSVTVYDLARLALQASHQADQVPADQQNNPQAWVNAAVSLGIPVTTVSSATAPLAPLVLPIPPTTLTTSTTPSGSPPSSLPVGDPSYGTILKPLAQLFVFSSQPNPATPTGPKRGARI